MKGKGWPTSEGKQDTPPTKNNMATISRLDDINSKKTNSEHFYIAKEQQARNVLHSHCIAFKHDTETIDAGNPYDPYASSSECSSECSYNHKDENK